MTAAAYLQTQPTSNLELLRSEYGWTDVSKGLGRVLVGYVVLIVGSALSIGLIGYGVMAILGGPKKQPAAPGHLWLVYGGLGLMSIVSLFGFGTVLAGKLNCLIHTPERCGARWMIFGCITCLLLGPALSVAAWVSGLDQGLDFQQGPDGLNKLKFNNLGTVLLMASTGITITSMVFFLLFLRIVATCFGDTRRMAQVTTYLFVVVGLFLGSLALMTYSSRLLDLKKIMPFLGVLWVGAIVWHLVLIARFRGCITEGMSQVRALLQMPLRGGR